MSYGKSWFHSLLRRRRVEREMEAEIESHIERYSEDLAARGVPPAEARRRARVEFGAVEAVKDECREALGLRWTDEFRRNLRHAARLLRKSPAFTATTVLTLALCIGVNTAVFSVVDAVLLRALPYPEPERLVTFVTHFQGRGMEEDQTSQNGRTWLAVHEHATYLDCAAFGGGWTGVNFAAQGKVEYVQQERVSAGFFRVLGINPMLGREFMPEEDRVGGPAVTVLSYALWKRVFNADPSVIDRAVLLRGEPYTIVGVMPPGFQTSVPADLWTPLRPSTTGEGGGTNYHIVARLRPGVTWAQADSQVNVVGAPMLQERRLPPDVSAWLRLIPLQQGLTQGVRMPLLILIGAVGVVLLIGCVNIAGLLLARAAARTREIATRLALGGGRGAVLRQMLTESLLLAFCGGAVGVALGWLGMQGLRLLAKDTLGIWQTLRLDLRVLGVTAGLSLVTSLVFGVLPALEASRVDVCAALAEGGGRGVAGRRSRWLRRSLVLGEVALGMVLLIGAGLLIRTFAYLVNLRPGFDPTNVITANLSLQDARYTSSRRVNQLFEQSLARIRELPGVESAAVGLSVPYVRPLNVGFRRLDGPRVDDKTQIMNLIYITPEYFQTLRIPLLRGRLLTGADGPGSTRVVVVNEAFVRKYLPEQDPLGSHLRIDGAPSEIVGVVGDVQQRPGWGDYGPLAPMPGAFMPAAQTSDKFLQLAHTWFSPSWVVRTSVPQGGVIAGMQRAVEAIDPQLPFAGFRSMADVRSRSLSEQRVGAILLTILGGLALVLAAVGIYGLIANSVAERTRELGIRMALGATTGQAMRAVALPGVALALGGVIVGCVLARAAAQVLRHLVWGVSATDAVTFGMVALTLLLVSAAASFIPALRVARLNPAQTLREE